MRLALSILAILLFGTYAASAACVQDTGSDSADQINKSFDYLICLHNEQIQVLNRHADKLNAYADKLNSHEDAINEIALDLRNLDRTADELRVLISDNEDEVSNLRTILSILEDRISALNDRVSALENR